MNNTEYLNEEKYQTAKKKIIRISLIILIAGLLIGAGFMIFAALKQKEAKKINEQRYQEAYKQSEAKVEAAKARLAEIEAEKEPLIQQYNEKSQECDSLNMRDSDWYAKVNQCHREASEIDSKIDALESEQFQLEHGDYTVYYTMILPSKYNIFYIIGGIIMGVSILASILVYIFAKKREIKVFKIQQSMPVQQEAITKMAPTVGNAAGTISQGIASGISQGLNNNQGFTQNNANFQNSNVNVPGGQNVANNNINPSSGINSNTNMNSNNQMYDSFGTNSDNNNSNNQ